MFQEQYATMIFLGIGAIVIYSMYRYFSELSQCSKFECHKNMKEARSHYLLMEQKLKDGLQGNDVCHRSALDKIWNDITKIQSQISILENARVSSQKKEIKGENNERPTKPTAKARL
jgi:hypothetical protein